MKKIAYFINYIFAILLLVGYALPYIAPKSIPYLSVLSITIPVLIIANLVFVIFWLITFKRYFILSTVCILLGYFVSTPLYIFRKNKNTALNEISVMNYNVKLFNYYNWIKDKKIPNKINTFIKKENPDILCIQEYYSTSPINYPYKHVQTVKGDSNFGQAIYSKFKIINKGAFNFEGTSNNVIFVDVVNKLDTIRVYNVHLESLSLHINQQNFGQKSSKKLMNRLSKKFKEQQNQMESILEHKKKSPYPVILTGDFNNTAYSWVYSQLEENMTDSFLEVGSGFGKTFSLRNYPMRIDFIFADKTFTFTEHKNYTTKYSDHEPIMARFGI